MGILQGIFGYLRNSAKKLAQAIFGWAVQALFGNVRENEKTLLSVVVGAAAGWPVLLLGVAFPKIATFFLAFVPIPEWVPSNLVRLFWILAAVLVPSLVGLALARRGNAQLLAEPFWKRVVDGFPVTLALGAAFAAAFVTAPIRRLRALSKRWQDEHVPLLADRDDYDAVAEEVKASLLAGGFDVRRAPAPFLLTAPSRVLRKLGGSTLGSRIPERLAFYRSDRLEAAVHPAGVTLQGTDEGLALAHALISESGTFTAGLQTTDVAAQELEARLKDIWRVYARDPASHEESAVLSARLEEVTRELTETPLDYEQWQVLYRELLQISRALRGREQLIRQAKEVPDMNETKTETRRRRLETPAELRSLSNAELVSGLVGELRALVQHEVALARSEIRADWKAELAMAKWLGVSLVAALCFVETIFVTVVLVLAQSLSAWLAGGIVAAFLLVVSAAAAFIGWSRKVVPLESTRKSLKDSWDWARNRAA